MRVLCRCLPLLAGVAHVGRVADGTLRQVASTLSWHVCLASRLGISSVFRRAVAWTRRDRRRCEPAPPPRRDWGGTVGRSIPVDGASSSRGYLWSGSPLVGRGGVGTMRSCDGSRRVGVRSGEICSVSRGEAMAAEPVLMAVWPVVRRSVRAVLIDDEVRLLMIKRTRPGVAPYWTTPGGGIEPLRTLSRRGRGDHRGGVVLAPSRGRHTTTRCRACQVASRKRPAGRKASRRAWTAVRPAQSGQVVE